MESRARNRRNQAPAQIVAAVMLRYADNATELNWKHVVRQRFQSERRKGLKRIRKREVNIEGGLSLRQTRARMQLEMHRNAMKMNTTSNEPAHEGGVGENERTDCTSLTVNKFGRLHMHEAIE